MVLSVESCGLKPQLGQRFHVRNQPILFEVWTEKRSVTVLQVSDFKKVSPVTDVLNWTNAELTLL